MGSDLKTRDGLTKCIPTKVSLSNRNVTFHHYTLVNRIVTALDMQIISWPCISVVGNTSSSSGRWQYASHIVAFHLWKMS